MFASDFIEGDTVRFAYPDSKTGELVSRQGKIDVICNGNILLTLPPEHRRHNREFQRFAIDKIVGKIEKLVG